MKKEQLKRLITVCAINVINIVIMIALMIYFNHPMAMAFICFFYIGPVLSALVGALDGIVGGKWYEVLGFSVVEGIIITLVCNGNQIENGWVGSLMLVGIMFAGYGLGLLIKVAGILIRKRLSY